MKRKNVYVSGGKERRTERRLAQGAWWVFQPLILTETLSMVFAPGLFIFEDSEEQQKSNKSPRLYGIDHFIVSCLILFRPQICLATGEVFVLGSESDGRGTALESPRRATTPTDARLDETSFYARA